jgi:hypothetical protein
MESTRRNTTLRKWWLLWALHRWISCSVPTRAKNTGTTKVICNALLPAFQILTCHSGKWIGQVPIPEKSLESSEARLQGEEKESFLDFMRTMLQWKPEDRCAIERVFREEWILADLIKAGKIKVVREEWRSRSGPERSLCFQHRIPTCIGLSKQRFCQ